MMDFRNRLVRKLLTQHYTKTEKESVNIKMDQVVYWVELVAWGGGVLTAT